MRVPRLSVLKIASIIGTVLFILLSASLSEFASIATERVDSYLQIEDKFFGVLIAVRQLYDDWKNILTGVAIGIAVSMFFVSCWYFLTIRSTSAADIELDVIHRTDWQGRQDNVDYLMKWGPQSHFAMTCYTEGFDKDLKFERTVGPIAITLRNSSKREFRDVRIVWRLINQRIPNLIQRSELFLGNIKKLDESSIELINQYCTMKINYDTMSFTDISELPPETTTEVKLPANFQNAVMIAVFARSLILKQQAGFDEMIYEMGTPTQGSNVDIDIIVNYSKYSMIRFKKKYLVCGIARPAFASGLLCYARPVDGLTRSTTDTCAQWKALSISKKHVYFS